MTNPDKHIADSLDFSSAAVHAGNRGEESTGGVITPLVMANSYNLPADPTEVDWSDWHVPLYTRNSGFNQLALQEKLAALEGAEDCVAFASGVGALYAVFFSFLNSGDHVVVSNQTYEATWRLFAELLPPKYGIEATFVDTASVEEVTAALQDNTRMIVTETIANPTTRVADIRALSEISRAKDLLLVVDSTFTPPPVARPLELGADLVVHSLTKYINGHGDAMGGAVLGPATLIAQLKSDPMVDLGATISPFNAWLISRGASTLPLRMARHQDSAVLVAQFLADQPAVAWVDYPGLTEHDGHKAASAQFAGFGALLSFAVEGDSDVQNRFVSNLRLVTSAVSLGHPETLIVHVGTDGPRVVYYPERYRVYGHLRMAIGLEDPQDIIADLKQALDATFSE